MNRFKHFMILALALTMNIGAWAANFYISYSGTWPASAASHVNAQNLLVLDYEPNRLVSDVKQEIAEYTGFSVSGMTLSYGNYNNLADDHMITDPYNFQKESTMVLEYTAPATAPVVTRTAQDTWRFAMTGYDAALNVEYYPPTLTFAATGNGTVTFAGTSATATLFNAPSEWASQTGTPVSTSDMPGFVEVSQSQAETLAASLAANSTASNVCLIFATEGNDLMYIRYVDGNLSQITSTTFTKNFIAAGPSSGIEFYYTTVGLPAGVEANPAGGYYVETGTEVTLIATADSAYYLAGWSNQSTNDTLTFTMGDSDTNFTASFALIPVLTLASNNVEMGHAEVVKHPEYELYGSYTPSSSNGTKVNFTNYSVQVTDGAWNNTSSTTTGSLGIYPNWSYTPQVTIDHVTLYDANGQSYEIAPNDGNSVYLYFNNGKVYSDWNCTQLLVEGGVTRVEAYGLEMVLPAGVTATATPGVYTVVSGTEVPVAAVPRVHHHLDNWSNNATTDTVTVTVNEAMTLTANFAASPELTIATNDDQMGSADITRHQGEGLLGSLKASDVAGQSNGYINGMYVGGPEVPANGTEWTNNNSGIQQLYISTQQSSQENKNKYKAIFYGPNGEYYVVDRSGANSGNNDGILVYLSNGNTYSGWDQSTMLWQGGVTEIELYGTGKILPDGVAHISGTTYSVRPGAEVPVEANANLRYHFVNWSNSSTETQTTFTMPATSATLTATFAQNPTLTLAASPANDGSVAFDFTPTPQTLTVNDGTVEQQSVPIWPCFLDVFATRGQHIIPAKEIGMMAGGTINSITYYFHIFNSNQDWTSTSQVNVYLKEVTNTTLTAYEESDTTHVYHGTLSLTNNGTQMTITFNEPYTYQGGNLLVGMDNTAAGNYICGSFLGVNAPAGSSAGGMGGNFDPQSFLPKATFNYTPVLPLGVLANSDGTYNVATGTQLTLKATANEGNYFVGWNDQSTDATLAFTMGDSDTTLTANFAPNPTLTLVTNGNGTLTIDGVQDRFFNANNMPAVGDTLYEGDVLSLEEISFNEWKFFRNGNISPGNAGFGGSKNNPATIGANGYLSLAGETMEPAISGNPVEAGNAWKVVNVENTCCITLEGILVDNPGPVNRMPAGVTETAAEGQYRVLPGTTLTLIATADEVNYVSSWSNEVAVNNLTTATQTLTIEADTTIAANFAQNPVLTIAVNDDQMGSAALVFENSQDVFDYPQSLDNSEHFRLDWSSGSGNGIDLYNNGVTYHSQHGEIINSVTLTLYGYTDQTIVVSPGEWDPTTRTISNVNSTSLNIKCTDSYNVLLSGAEIDYSVMPAAITYNTVRESRDVTLNNGNFYGIYGGGFYWIGQIGGTTAMLNDGNNGQILTSASNDPAAQIEGVTFTVTQGTAPTFEPAGMTVTESGSQVILSDIPAGTRTIKIINQTGESFSFTAIDVQYSVPVPIPNQYRVLPGTTVTVKATAAPIHHVASWSDEEQHDLSALATYSDYFVTDPDNLFPAVSTLDVTVTGDTTLAIEFGINSYNVTATVNNDNRETIGTGLPMGTVQIAYTDINDQSQTTAAAATAEATVQGGSSCILTAEAETGYHFVEWNDGVADNPRTLSLATDSSFTALFAPNKYTVTYYDVNTEMNVDTFEYLQYITDYTITREEYTLVGWDPVLPAQMPAENLTVYAKWEYNCISIQDVDQNTYPTVKLGNMCWMAENLRTTHYSDGEEVPFAIVYANPVGTENPSNLATYGRLYNYSSATRDSVNKPVQGVCPQGWHLPSAEEFNVLIGQYSVYDLRSTDNWMTGSFTPQGTNSTGFNMEPAGIYNAAKARCENVCLTCYYYTAEVIGGTAYVSLYSYCGCDQFSFELDTNPDNGYSVRCVRGLGLQ